MGSSARAGCPVYRSTAEGRYYDYICDLGNRLEVNLDSSHQPTVNIWIEEPVQEPTASDEDTKAGVEAIHAAKALAKTLSVPLSTVYTELRRGRTGDRLPDQRLEYDAKLAQLKMQQELEQRGRKTARA